MTVEDIITKYKKKMAEAEKNFVEISQLYKELVDAIRDIQSPHNEILLVLRKMVEDPYIQDANFWINAAQEHPSPIYIETLCTLLSIENNRIWYEGIIQILGELKDERAIPALKKALTYDLDYDEWNRIAIESLDALTEIGTDDAIKIIREQTTSPIERIREEAKHLLQFLENKI